MLLSQKEARFHFNDAKFDLTQASDRKFLGWVFNQFLYGEITGIQCGYWLYHAHSFNAASFLARQAVEELSHVHRVLKILSLLGEKPGPAHWAVRFLSTNLMGGSWGEHVALEMALGEGLVLTIFYAMLDTIPDPAIQKLLESAITDEEKHMVFGEQQTLLYLKQNPNVRKILLALVLIQTWILRKFKKSIVKQVARYRNLSDSKAHPVLGQFEAFYNHILQGYGLKIERLGISNKPLQEISFLTKLYLIIQLPFLKIWIKLMHRTPLLTSAYLKDPDLH